MASGPYPICSGIAILASHDRCSKANVRSMVRCHAGSNSRQDTPGVQAMSTSLDPRLLLGVLLLAFAPGVSGQDLKPDPGTGEVTPTSPIASSVDSRFRSPRATA